MIQGNKMVNGSSKKYMYYRGIKFKRRYQFPLNAYNFGLNVIHLSTNYVHIFVIIAG